MRKVTLIYNPSAGESRIPALLDSIIEIYQSRDDVLIPHRLDFSAEGRQRLINKLKQGWSDQVLIAGGDGTINYVINLIVENEIDVPIGFIPAGTANDFALGLNMPTDILDAVRVLADGKEERIDLGRANDIYFVNVFSCGLFTEVSQKTPTVLKNAFGRMAYYLGGIGELSRFRMLDIEIEADTGEFKGKSLLFFVFNGRTAGRMRLARNAEFNDGLLDLVVVKGENPVGTLGKLASYLASRGKNKKYPEGVYHLQCSELKIKCKRAEPTDIDGQPGPDFPITITCEKKAQRVILPK